MNIENMIQGNPQALVKSVNGIMVADSLQVRRPIHTALSLQHGKRQRYRQRLRKPWDW